MQNTLLIKQAKEFSQDAGYVSVSSLQRKFILGYEQAKQLADVLIQQDFCEADFTVGQGYLILQKSVKTTLSFPVKPHRHSARFLGSTPTNDNPLLQRSR